MIITIDGPAGSGKSTIAELVANKLGFLHFNSGNLYRAVCCHLLSKKFNIDQITSESKVPKMKLDISYVNNRQIVLVDGVDHSARLRDNEVSVLSPIVSVNKNVRAMIDKAQRSFAKKHDLVAEGRDMGSFVFPDADCKFYLDCSLQERAKRRFKEEVLKNNNISFEEIKVQIKERDKIDKNKPYAPLVVPKNAIVIDCTHLTIEQVTNKILTSIKK